MKTEATDLTGLLRLALDDFATKIHTSIPGAIVSYDATTKKAQVQPLIQKRIWQGGALAPIPLPVIYNVPVQFPGTPRWQISGDLQKGDTGAIMFSEASLDAWLSGSGGQVDPKDDRRFDINDAYFVPGIATFTAPGIAGVSSGLLLKYLKSGGGDAAQILLKDDGTISINGGSQGVARNGDATLANATTDAAFWTFLQAVATFCSLGTAPSSLTGKANAGSSTVKAG
jgi:hypothetical protein